MVARASIPRSSATSATRPSRSRKHASHRAGWSPSRPAMADSHSRGSYGTSTTSMSCSTAYARSVSRRRRYSGSGCMSGFAETTVTSPPTASSSYGSSRQGPQQAWRATRVMPVILRLPSRDGHHERRVAIPSDKRYERQQAERDEHDARDAGDEPLGQPLSCLLYTSP